MKMTWENRACELAVAPDLYFRSDIPCDLEPDTIAYALRRYFLHSARLREDCTDASVRMRLAKGKARRSCRYHYAIPAALLELPGTWAKVTVRIDATGAVIQRLELRRTHPFLRRQMPVYRNRRAGATPAELRRAG